MIITLQEAQAIDPAMTQDRLDAYEWSIRSLTHNNFQITSARAWGVNINGNIATLTRDVLTKSLQVGDTIEFNIAHALYDYDNDYLLDRFEYGSNLEIGYGRVNDNLYTAAAIQPGEVTLDRAPRLSDNFPNATLTYVYYPPDVKEGVKRLIAYDKNMANKSGIKMEYYGRLRVDYYDVTQSGASDGYPANLMSFANKYKKMYWGG